jgi:hypothetical protein
MSTERNLLAALNRLARQRRRGQPHLTSGELDAYQSGDLAPDREEAARNHLAVCPDCVTRLTALTGFPRLLSDQDGDISQDEVEQALAAVLSQVRPQERDTVESKAGPEVNPRRPSQQSWGARPRWMLAVSAVAALLGIAIGLGFAGWMSSRQIAAVTARAIALERDLAQTSGARKQLEAQLERSRRALVMAQDKAAASAEQERDWLRPHVNTPIEMLRATSLRGSQAENVPRVLIPPEADFVTLVLEDPQDETFSRYRIEVRGPSSEKVAEAGGLLRTPFRNFVITLPGRILPAGRLSLRLVGVAPAREKEIATYAVKILR